MRGLGRSRSRRRRLEEGLAAVEAQVDLLRRDLASARADADQTRSQEIPGLLALSERRLLVAIEDAAAATHEHTEAAVDAAHRSAVAAAREHTEAAVASAVTMVTGDARRHAEAAVADAVAVVTSAAREHAEAAAEAAERSARAAAREHAEALGHQTAEDLAARLADLRRELRTIQRLGAPAATAPAAAPAGSGDGAPRSPLAAAANAVDPGFYVALEDRFRGDPAVIEARQKVYIPLVADVADAEHPVVDLGCGRGEWLRILRQAGIPGLGVDTNPAFVAEVDEAGLDVVDADLVEFLRGAADGAFGAITLFQVVEHLPLPTLLDVMASCARALRPGGVLIAETPNSTNLRVASSTFWIDPTHERPLHPELLRFIASYVGFSKVDGWFLNELAERPLGLPDDATGAAIARLVELVDGPGDFTLLAWR